VAEVARIILSPETVHMSSERNVIVAPSPPDALAV
jgi:hypothetical protein